MKKIFANYFYLSLFFIVLGSMVSSCKKDKGSDGAPKQLSDADSLTYLMYNIMQVSVKEGGRDLSNNFPLYYWYDKVPKLDPLSSTYDSADVLLNQIKTYAINPTTAKPYDKYSFLDKTGAVAGEIQQGVAGDLGMEVRYAGDGTAAKTSLYVIYADKNSPAGKLGVSRGWKITAVNGNQVIYDGSNGSNVKAVINAVYYDASASFTFKKTDGSSQTSTLAKTVYDINPILFDTIYTLGGKKVGYFVFNSFANVQNSNGPTLTKSELDRVFAKFTSAGINSLIVDLRYNGGGAVATTEYIDNMIAPASAQGKEMYHYLYNDKITPHISDFGLSDKINFTNAGGLNLDHVFFIGTSSTASASELTINNLKPYMDVKLVGETTYGKPVGFIGLTISDFPNGQEKDLADLYSINFETRNANNQGGYFTGLVPDAAAVDYVDVPWGDPTDDNLGQIFNYVSNGKFGRSGVQERMAKNKSLQISIPSTIHPLRFNGMVNYKLSSQIQKLVDKSLRRTN